MLRSGEHNEFTRFVLAFAEPVDVSTQHAENWFTLTFSDEVALDVSRAFERINRQRVSTISVDPKRLSFEKVCDCNEKLEWHSERILVVDVLPNDHDEGLPVNSPAPRRDAFLPFWQRFNQKDAEPNSFLYFAPTNNERQMGNTLLRDKQPWFVTLNNSLANDIGRGLTEGTLTPNTLKEAAKGRKIVEAAAGDVVDFPNLASHSGIEEQLNLKVRSATDINLTGTGDNSSQNTEASCPAQGNFDVAAWNPGKSFFDSVSLLRRNLVGEFDQVDHDVALKLARVYAYFGFGAESNAITSLIDTSDPAVSSVRRISTILEYGSDNTDLEERYLECGGALAFWTAISLSEIPSDVLFDEDASIRHLGQLPEHLKRILAPELSKRLRIRGSVKRAALVMRATEISQDPLSSGSWLEVAQIESSINGATQDEATVLEFMKRDDTEAPLALVSFINQQVEEGQEISPDIALLAESFALQFRGTSIERSLIAAHMIALAKSDQFDKAMSLLYSQPDLQRSQLGQVDNLFLTLAESAPDILFLKYAKVPLDDTNIETSERTRLLLASRALELGFPNISERFLLTIVDAIGLARFQEIKAQLLLSMDQPSASLEAISDTNSQKAIALRAMALYEAEEYQRAASLFDELQNRDDYFEAAFRSDAPLQFSDVLVDEDQKVTTLQALERLRSESSAGDAMTIRNAESLLRTVEQIKSDSTTLLESTSF